MVNKSLPRKHLDLASGALAPTWLDALALLNLASGALAPTDLGVLALPNIASGSWCNGAGAVVAGAVVQSVWMAGL